MDINSVQNIRPTATSSSVSRNNARAEVAISDRVQQEQARAAQAAQVEQEQENTEPSVSESIREAVSNLNEFSQSIRRNLSFSLQNETGRVVVEVTDSETGELIRKIPSDEALQIAERISETRSLLPSVKV